MESVRCNCPSCGCREETTLDVHVEAMIAEGLVVQCASCREQHRDDGSIILRGGSEAVTASPQPSLTTQSSSNGSGRTPLDILDLLSP